MIKLELASQEQYMLIQILTSYLSDLRFEIADTDRMELREKLKEQELFLKKILNILNSAHEENLSNE